MNRPKHSHCQHSRDNQCERDIQILAHVNRVYVQGAERKEKLRLVQFSIKAKEAANQGVGGSDKHSLNAGSSYI